MDALDFSQLPAELQAAIFYQDLVAGQVLFYQGDPMQAVFTLDSGYLRLVYYTEDGQQISHYGVRAGEGFAEVALFSEAYVCTAIADVPSRVLVLPKQPFLTALRQHPDLAESFMAQLARRLHKTKILLQLRSIRSARQRVLHYLQLLIQPGRTTVNLDRPFKDIADDLSLTPEALSRALSQLQKEGLIIRRKREVAFCKEFPKLDFNHGNS